MKLIKIILITFPLFFNMLIFSATYDGKSIDKTHYTAFIWMKDTETKYKVDVVFLKRIANIVLPMDQNLPFALKNRRFLTLYLNKEEIEDPEAIPLRQIVPPVLEDGEKIDPDKCKTAANWFMNVDLTKPGKKENN